MAPQTELEPSYERKTIHEVIRRACGFTSRLLCRPEINGLDNIPAEGSFIVASNHLSFLDSALIQGVFPRPVSFIAKAEYFTGKGVKGAFSRTFFEAFGSVPVDRDQQSGAVAALSRLAAIVDAGHAVGIYPEGTRSRDGRLYRGKNGVGWLALKTGAPVIPVGLIGTQKLQAPGKMMIRPQFFTMNVGQPIHVEHLGPRHGLAIRRETTSRIMDAIAGLSGQERVAEYNARPATDGQTPDNPLPL